MRWLLAHVMLTLYVWFSLSQSLCLYLSVALPHTNQKQHTKITQVRLALATAATLQQHSDCHARVAASGRPRCGWLK